MTKQKIFFSYSRVDGSAYALRLATDLKKKGFDVWIDQQDIRAGLEWDSEIEKALEACDCVLFLETEKSVVSHNVLDEVYYALEQKKKVIPLIYVDSKTPFRLNRLQHIDFTKSYEAGFERLVNELNGMVPADAVTGETEKPVSAGKPLQNKKRLWILVAAVVILAAAFFFTTSRRNNLESAAGKEAVASRDTTAGHASESTAARQETAVIPSDDQALSHSLETNDAGKKAPAVTANSNRTATLPKEAVTERRSVISVASISGDWQIVDVQPKAASHRGYLKIEALDENKATIKSYLQFYYPDSESSSHLTIFNAFAGCTSCTVANVIKLKVEDIAIGSRMIKRLTEDQADGRKAGEVIMDANSNKSVGGTMTLQFADNDNAIIKVKQPLTIPLANDFMLEPFEYTFHLKKTN